MVRKNKNRHSSGGRGGRIGSGPSSTVSCSIPELQKFVPGESLKRPGFVSAGESYIVKANHFKLTYNETLCRYHVLIDPKPTSAGDVMIQLAKLYGQSRLGGRLPAYDGKKSLYTSRPFPFTCEAFKVTLPDQENILCGLPSCKRMNGSLQSWYWYKSYQCSGSTQLQDISCKPFINPLPVINLVALLLNRDISDDPFDFCERLKQYFQLCANFPSNIDKKSSLLISLPLAHGQVCEISDAKQISYLLSVACQHPMDHEKTILQGFGFRAVAVAEASRGRMSGSWEPSPIPLDVLLRLRMAFYLRVRLHLFFLEQTVNPYNEDPHAKEFGITFENKLTIVKGRVLPPPVLKFNDQGKVKEFLPKVGKWNMRLKQMVKGGEVNTWACINFASDITHAAAVAFCDELAVMCVISGMNFKGDPVLPLVNAKPNHVRPFLKKHYQRFMEILRPLHKELDLLIVILPDKNGTLYGDIKRICETDLGLVSQCCLAKHVLKMKPQYLTNIALKINMKVGGRNTVLLDAVVGNLPRVSNTPTIIFGADVSHPHHGEGRSSPSIAAVVASQDWPEVTNYAGLVRPQARHEEIIQGLFNENDCGSGCISGGMIKDVVSKGRLNMVLEHELSAIKKACASLDPIYNPQVTIIMVQKQHHTRLFAGNYGVGSTIFQSGNVLPVPPVHYAHLLASRARLYIGYKGKLPDIKDNVKKRGMFFC
uniref:Protein argonaute 1B n=1 Tax=Aegilops tauschii TaxID=37682 RepID=M8BNW6_AEGTA